MGNDELVDIIPLKEILTVKFNGTEQEFEVDPFSSFTSDEGQDSNKGYVPCIIEISTLPDGYGSNFQSTNNLKEYQRAILEDLTRFLAIEIEKTIAKSKLKRIQKKIAHT